VRALPQKNNLTFRSGHYTGRGWEVQEYAQTLQEGIPNYGGQLGWYMVRVEQCIRYSPMREENLTPSGSCVQGHVAEPLPFSLLKSSLWFTIKVFKPFSLTKA